MSKHIEGKVNRMDLTAVSLFNYMTDEDFMAVHRAGQLKNLCLALSLDIQRIKDEKFERNNTYTA